MRQCQPSMGGFLMVILASEPTELPLAPGYIVVLVAVQLSTEWESRKVLIDSGATSNFISQHCVKELELLPASTVCRTDTCLLDGQHL